MAWQDRREASGSGFDWLSGLIPSLGVSDQPGPNSAPPSLGVPLTQPIPGVTNRPDSQTGLFDWLASLLGGSSTATPKTRAPRESGPPSITNPYNTGGSSISGLPASPEGGPIGNWLKSLNLGGSGASWRTAAGLPIPPGWKDPAPKEEKTPGAPGQIDTSGAGGNITIPRIPGKTSGGRGDFSVDLGEIPKMPAPPMQGAAPQMAVPGAPDFSGAKKSLEEGRPTGPNTEELSKLNLSQVLAGLASGAGGVSATEPGSFAKALAMSGAGGAQGRSSVLAEGMKQQQEYEKQKQAYGLARAGHEVHMANAAAQSEQIKAQIEFNNNKLQWDTTHGNALKTYEHQLAVRGESMPQVKYDAQGVHVTKIDPVTRQMTTETYDTKKTLDQAEKLKDVFTALGASSPVAQNYETRITQQMGAGMDPVAAHAQMKQLAVRQVLSNGAGGVVFGDAWPKAIKQVEATMDATMKTTKPLEYKQIVEQQAAAYLLSIAKNDNWLKKAAAYSPAAGVIIRVPTQAPTGAPSGE